MVLVDATRCKPQVLATGRQPEAPLGGNARHRRRNWTLSAANCLVDGVAVWGVTRWREPGIFVY